MIVDVEELSFTFPDAWSVLKFDDTVFYRGQFSKMWSEIKAVDILAISDTKAAYLIEVKDYRLATEAGPRDLAIVVAKKVFDTLAAQIPCKLNANEAAEQELAALICGCHKLTVVLHLEHPTISTGIFRPYDRANLQQKLRQLLKPIHAHPWVLQKEKMATAEWTVT